LLPAIQANAARVIALPGGRRRPNLPDIPTVGEIYLGYDISSWTGFFVPAATPETVQDRIAAALHAALKDPQIAARIADTGCDATVTTRAEFKALVDRDQAMYARLIREGGVRAE
jgi:tripartite-type tricarboxylate transporter receptor subunit TctC